MNSPETCTHCNLPIPKRDQVSDRIGNRELHFCCQGCRGAYAIIIGAGLDAFYQKRTWEQPGTPEGAFEDIYNDTYLDSFVTTHDNEKEISFVISGIRCSACIWLIESILGKLDGVWDAVVNYGSHQGRVRFNPVKTSAASIFQSVARLGYIPKPFTKNALYELQEQESRSLLIRFGTAAFLSMQLMGFSIALYGGYFSGMDRETKQLMQYFAALVTTPIVFFSGKSFLQGAWASLRNKTANMDLLIAMGVLTAYFYSLGALLFGREIFFETAAMIITLILLGRIFENNARKKAYAGIDKLVNLAPDTTRLVKENETIVVTSSQLNAGDIIVVAPGDRLPVDGILLDQQTEVDESMLTGEADPVVKKTNDMLLSGALNISTTVRVLVTQTAAKSFMGRISRMVEEAQTRKAPVQGIADRVAGMFIPAVIIIALGTSMYWAVNGPAVSAILNGISVLVVACPCALGLATPTALLVATGLAAQHGFLFRGGDTLEATSRVTLAAFDKTGTLTEAFPQVEKIYSRNGNELEVLSLAAQLEAGSSHPLAKGILAMASREGIRPSPGEATIIPGKGVEIDTETGKLVAGNRSFLEEYNITIPDHLITGSMTEVHVVLANAYQGCIYLSSKPRSGAKRAISEISTLGLQTVLLTGDNHLSAEHIAKLTDIDSVHAEMQPIEKAEWVRKRSNEGEKILMVGDGVNDSPALKEAAVGCAMGGGTDTALETSDLVLMHNNLGQLSEAIRLSRKTLTIIRQNLFWAFSYNLIAIPLAATGHLAPVYGAAAMAGSSLCVIANSLRIRGVRLNQQVPEYLYTSLNVGGNSV